MVSKPDIASFQLLLTPTDRRVVERCLRAVLDDVEVVQDREFSTVFGIDRPRFREFVDRWERMVMDPNRDAGWPAAVDDPVDLVRAVIANLLWYPHPSPSAPPRSELESLYGRLFPAAATHAQ